MIDNIPNLFSKTDPIISVIVPCFNAGKTILKTLNSLEDQQFNNFEVIIVNDGSFDNSDIVIKKFITNSKLNIQYKVQKNSGVSIARNVGLEISKGNYIVFLDSDDVYHKNFLNTLYTIFTKYDVDTIFCSYTRNIEELKSNNSKFGKIKHLNHEQLMTYFMYRKGPCAFVNFLYKRDILEKYNIKFEDKCKYGEDLEFTWKYLSHCRNGIFLNLKLYGYYDNPNSAVNNINWNITNALDSVKRVEDYLLKYNDEYYIIYKNYMFDRTIWAIMKDFAYSDNKDDYQKLIDLYNIKVSMQNMMKRSNSLLIKLTALFYLINPYFFYWFIAKLKRR